MTAPPSLLEDGGRSSSRSRERVEETLAPKSTLTSSDTRHGIPPSGAAHAGLLGHSKEGMQRHGRANLPSFVKIPEIPKATDTALAALQYLPTPVLVLSSLKTVVMANDAMGVLLGLYNDELEAVEDEEDIHIPVSHVLQGQTLSQIGIDMIQDGRPIWVNWEIWLDGLADEMDRRAYEAPKSKPADGTRSHNAHSAEPRQQSRATRGQALVHDSVVDVVLSSQYIGRSREGRGHKPSMSMDQVHAKMVISIWTFDNQRFFTLCFSGKGHDSLSSSTRTQSRTISRTSGQVLSPGSIHSTTPSSNGSPSFVHCCAHCGAPPSSISQTSPTGAQLTMAPFPVSSVAAAPSVLQKTLKMKDAILNAMEVPIFAMWKDETLAFPNKAAVKLMGKAVDPTSEESYDPLSRFKAFTENFSRELEPEEYPIVELCRTQKSFKGRKIGYKDAKGAELVFDVTGEAVYDEKTREFIVGMTSMKDVTEYAEKLKTQAEQSERQFELICDTMPQILWTATPNGNHDWFSRRWYEFTRLSVEESLGSGWQATFHPDDMPETNKCWEHSLATGDEYSIEFRCRRYDGAWRWMLGRALPLRDTKTGDIIKWYGTCTDIHDQVETLEAAKRFREHLCSVIKHAHVTMWTIDRDRKLTFLEGQLMWGFGENGKDDLIGENIYDAFSAAKPNLDVRRLLSPIEHILDGTAKEHFSEHRIDGMNKWYRTRFLPITGKRGKGGTEDSSFINGVVGISFDVSELKRREADLRSQEQENLRLLSAETAAKEASRLKSQFLANMSHEIRTPIAGVIGMSELLSDTKLEDDQMECVENIQRSANGLLTVINDILDLSKVESGRLDIEEVQFSLTVVIKDVCKMMSFAAERKNLTFQEDIKIGMQEDLIVLGDPGRCRQILTNLLTNSIKFTSEGFVKLSVEAKGESDESISIIFKVEDTGIGIEEEVRKRLFKPFSQADSSTARRFGGTGLGLTICRNLVELMHGDIFLESVLGSGTEATFRVPFNKPQFQGGGMPMVNLDSISDRLHADPSASGHGSDQDHNAATPPLSPLDANSDPNRLLPRRQHSPSKASAANRPTDPELSKEERGKTHILVVEDNAINQQIAIRTIRKIGFSVNAVWNGKEALEYLLKEPSSEAPKPDVILMDVQMPILDGYRATHLIRHHNPYSSLPGMSSVPIVAMTASAIQGDREKCERAGMDDYLAKPVKGSTLEEMLVKWTLKRKMFAEKKRSLRSHHTDHDSNCTDYEVPAASKATDGASVTQPQRPELGNRAMTIYEHLGVENEGDRGLRRVAAAEKAEKLRNDKLLLAADVEDQLRHHMSPSSENEDLRLQPPPTALTEENIGRFGREQAEAEAVAESAVRISDARAKPQSMDSDSSLRVQEGQTQSPASSLGALRSPPSSARSTSRRRLVNRNDSSQSTLTIKASKD